MDSEDFDYPNSWISIKEIRKAAEIRTSVSISDRSLASVLPSLSKSPCKSPIASFPRLPFSPSKSPESKPKSNVHLQNPYFDIQELEKKYLIKIDRLNQEIFILSSQLKQANECILKLNDSLSEVKFKHALHLQALQERHEQRISKYKFDINSLFRQCSTRNSSVYNENSEKEHRFEISKLIETHQEEIKQQELYFLGAIQQVKDTNRRDTEKVKDQVCVIFEEFKHKLLEEIEYLEFVDKRRKNRSSRKSNKDFQVLNEDDNTLVEAENGVDGGDQGFFYEVLSHNFAARIEFLISKCEGEINGI